jgi:hypothetical protein
LQTDESAKASKGTLDNRLTFSLPAAYRLLSRCESACDWWAPEGVATCAIGRELAVRYVLEGSVRKAAGKFRIIGQLIDAATVAAPADPRRTDPRIWAGQCGMAGCGGVSMGATDDPVPDAERHDPDQCRRSTAAQGIRAVSCSTRFLGWRLGRLTSVCGGLSRP